MREQVAANCEGINTAETQEACARKFGTLNFIACHRMLSGNSKGNGARDAVQEGFNDEGSPSKATQQEGDQDLRTGMGHGWHLMRPCVAPASVYQSQHVPTRALRWDSA